MSFEKPNPIPENNELPLNITESEGLEHQGSESAIWQVKARSPEGQEQLLALKQVRRKEFSTEEEMKKSREFYDFLKDNPSFGKFVPDTLYFKAREISGGEPHAYKLQKMVEGKRVDELTDDELYGNTEVISQLSEFTDAAIATIKEGLKTKGHTPDLYGEKQLLANLLFNPRYSSNIMIAEKPDEKGRQVFFIDTNIQKDQAGLIGKEYQRRIGSKLQIHQLNRWKKEIEKRLGTGEEKLAA